MSWQVIVLAIVLIMGMAALQEIAKTLKGVVVELTALRELLARTARETAMRRSS